MPDSFTQHDLPLSARLCRSLVWAQAAYTLFGGAFLLLTAVLLGGGYAIPFHDGTVSGGSAAVLGMVYMAAALALGVCGARLGRRAPWAQPAIVSLEAFLAILQLYRAFELSVSSVVNLTLVAAILGLLFLPDTRHALEGPAQA